MITPLFESQTDHALMYQFAKKFGFDKQLVKNYDIWKPDGAAKFDEPTPESILKEINRCTWTIGYTGQSPERLKLHMKHQATFDVKTLRARGGPCDGDYYGLPWPSYGTPQIKHPGSPNLYDESQPRDGRRRLLPRQFRRRARWSEPAGRRRFLSQGVRTHYRAIRSSITCC